jgi:hypothetical protein
MPRVFPFWEFSKWRGLPQDQNFTQLLVFVTSSSLPQAANNEQQHMSIFRAISPDSICVTEKIVNVFPRDDTGGDFRFIQHMLTC